MLLGSVLFWEAELQQPFSSETDLICPARKSLLIATFSAFQEAELAKEQQEAQKDAQEWSARAQCAAIDALSPEQVRIALFSVALLKKCT